MRKFVPLCLVGLLFACGDDSSKKNSGRPPLNPIQAPFQSPGAVNTNVDPKLYSPVRANFQGKFIGVSDGQLFNFDEDQKPTTAVEFTFASNQNREKTIQATLPRRPQRIDVINDDYVLLQRPHYSYYTAAPEYKTVEFAQDCYLINVKSGLIWKFDEYFPIFSSIQTVQSGASKKILFIGLKKTEANGPSVSSSYVDLNKDYNYDTSKQNGYTRSSSSSAKKTLISIDFSDSSQVTLRPISSGHDDIETFLANAEGNVLAETGWSTRRTLAIMQNEQTPTEVTIYNANFTNYGTSEARIVKDSRANFWRLSRGGYDATSGKYSVKAERLTLTRDLDDRPALLPLVTLTQTTEYPVYFQYNAKPWSYQFKGRDLFGLGDGLFVVSAELNSLKFVSIHEGVFRSLDSTITNIDVQNGKVLSYFKPYVGGIDFPSFVEFDLNDLDAPKASLLPAAAKIVYGDLVSMTQRSTGGLDLESLDGPTRHFYTYNGLTSSVGFEKSIRADTDNRVRILVPVQTID